MHACLCTPPANPLILKLFGLNVNTRIWFRIYTSPLHIHTLLYIHDHFHWTNLSLSIYSTSWLLLILFNNDNNQSTGNNSSHRNCNCNYNSSISGNNTKINSFESLFRTGCLQIYIHQWCYFVDILHTHTQRIAHVLYILIFCFVLFQRRRSEHTHVMHTCIFLLILHQCSLLVIITNLRIPPCWAGLGFARLLMIKLKYDTIYAHMIRDSVALKKSKIDWKIHIIFTDECVSLVHLPLIW